MDKSSEEPQDCSPQEEALNYFKDFRTKYKSLGARRCYNVLTSQMERAFPMTLTFEEDVQPDPIHIVQAQPSASSRFPPSPALSNKLQRQTSLSLRNRYRLASDSQQDGQQHINDEGSHNPLSILPLPSPSTVLRQEASLSNQFQYSEQQYTNILKRFKQPNSLLNRGGYPNQQLLAYCFDVLTGVPEIRFPRQEARYCGKFCFTWMEGGRVLGRSGSFKFAQLLNYNPEMHILKAANIRPGEFYYENQSIKDFSLKVTFFKGDAQKMKDIYDWTLKEDMIGIEGQDELTEQLFIALSYPDQHGERKKEDILRQLFDEAKLPSPFRRAALYSIPCYRLEGVHAIMTYEEYMDYNNKSMV